jgi:Zn-dependent protease with chaperone function
MTTTQIRCPQCSAALTVDPHWPTWCDACDWGLDPNPENAPRHGPVSRWWRTRLNRISEREHQRLVREGLGGVQSADRVIVVLVATLVHLVTVGPVVLAVVLARSEIWIVARIGAPVLLLGIVSQVRPRLPRQHHRGKELTRSDAPALFSLCDRLAAILRVAPPSTIVITDDVNAHWGSDGLRRQRVLGLGLPLWAVLGGQAKVAVVTHELAHEANGDLRSGWWVSSAVDALHHWQYLLTPARKTDEQVAQGSFLMTEGTGINLIAERVASLLIAPVLLVLGVFRVVLSDLSNRSGQRAEHVADRLSADLAGTSAALEVQTVLLAAEMLEFGLDVALRRDPAVDLWATARTFQASVPESERTRRIRLAARTLQAVDDTHPPTARRIDLLRAAPDVAATVILGAEEEQAIDAEVRLGELRVRSLLLDRLKS